MRYAVIENGLVVNAIVADEDYAQENKLVLMPDNVDIGWTYSNGEFIDNRPAPEIPVQPTQPTKEELLNKVNELMQQIQALS